MYTNLTILQINVFGKTMSTGRTVCEMHNFFLSNGISSFIATATNKECPDSYPISNPFGIKADILKYKITGYEAHANVHNTKKLLNYINCIKPDIVHLRNLHQSYINLKLLLRYLASKDIPTVLTLHDSWFFTGKCCSHSVYNCTKWITGCGHCPAIIAEPHRPFFDRTHRMWIDKKRLFSSIPRLAVVGNSKWTKSNAELSFLSCAKTITHIYNWIDLDVFYPRDASALRNSLRLKNKKIIIAVSSFWNINGTKGLRNYLRLSSFVPDNYHIILIGRLVSSINIPYNITFIDSVSNTSDLAYYYSMADVYLNLSESESFGKSVAEAVSCGTPVIAINKTANCEIIPEGAGILIEEFDDKVLLNSLKIIFSKQKEYYKKACVSFARKCFDKEKNIEEYLSVYYNLLGIKK